MGGLCISSATTGGSVPLCLFLGYSACMPAFICSVHSFILHYLHSATAYDFMPFTCSFYATCDVLLMSHLLPASCFRYRAIVLAFCSVHTTFSYLHYHCLFFVLFLFRPYITIASSSLHCIIPTCLACILFLCCLRYLFRLYFDLSRHCVLLQRATVRRTCWCIHVTLRTTEHTVIVVTFLMCLHCIILFYCCGNDKQVFPLIGCYHCDACFACSFSPPTCLVCMLYRYHCDVCLMMHFSFDVCCTDVCCCCHFILPTCLR